MGEGAFGALKNEAKREAEESTPGPHSKGAPSSCGVLCFAGLHSPLFVTFLEGFGSTGPQPKRGLCGRF